MTENIKKFRKEAKKLEESDALQQARKKYVSANPCDLTNYVLYDNEIHVRVPRFENDELEFRLCSWLWKRLLLTDVPPHLSLRKLLSLKRRRPQKYSGRSLGLSQSQ